LSFENRHDFIKQFLWGGRGIDLGL
jgi:hypothetical protein